MKKILSKLSRGRRGATPSRSDSPRCAWVRRREAKRSKSPKGKLAWWASPRAAGRSISVVALCSLLAGALGGCSGPTVSETGGSDVAASTSTSTSTEAASFEEVAAAFDVAALDLEYSNRDKDASYDDASATHIVLSGATATVDGDGASVEGSTVTISAEGTYVVSGSLDDGRLVVEVADTDKVQVVLNGASIHNEDGPAFYVRQADKCFVTLADGTTNTLTDGTD